MSDLTIALIGRPNVGKSTLFNRLVGSSQALVDKTPGLTRDWQEGNGKLGDITFKVIDTAGFEDEKTGTLAARMWSQSLKALSYADILLFVIDVKEGLTPLDVQMGRWIRTQNKPVLLIANKSENSKERLNAYDFFSLGFGDPILLSAAHGLGLLELYEELKKYAPAEDDFQRGKGARKERAIKGFKKDDETAIIDLAIVGRPNAGKSTFINALLGDERLLTGEEAGLTRDAIAVPFSFGGRDFRLIDTAGLRRKARVVESLERLSTKDTLEAIRLSQGVILVLDALMPLEKQDLTIARHVLDEGRMLILALNKWDLVKDPKAHLKEIKENVKYVLPQVRGIVCVPMSALKKAHIQDVLKAVLDLYPLWNKRLGTADLNRWLEYVLGQHPPPLMQGRPCKIRYVTQIKSRPPTFLAFSNRPEEVWPDSYKRYLLNSLRETFHFEGVPLRLNFKTSINPYADSEK
ncbi:MAG: ribosome biogenesis GTPase Der [Alphaproteobacteria bacterium 16-39-46]|nr:MAG: ribosome biogenesis GTPase Der [Alphaproteobacteria bacterium 16-39-46]OZA42199.1 MAG: ribosome biogenesis GTPase Der [Alphaproteobacteria bacterium 17-39-52]HQS84812.1 ribosome biogenesis GTPase Der [Alphaproteobacteria bacterium]HQS94373.1 ribosome biogenesis GTPase Der [Alphaproteobacteria bacterium]